MAWAVKYRTEFYDLLGKAWKVDILEDAFTGTITTLTATGEPLRFYYDNESDDVFDPIRESHADVQVYSLTNFALQDLYSIEDLQFKVNIYEETNLYWTGFIETQKYQEPYEDYPYPVIISCTDGLSVLKDTKYQNAGVDYTGRTYESKMILDILGKIEHTSFYEYVNIYDDQMLNSVDDSPYDQTKIDADCFENYYCYDVLKELLIKHNAVIRQKDGIFNIYRPKELNGTTVYGRYFTGELTKSSVTMTPLQYINRAGYASYRVQTPGGMLMVQNPIEQVTITHDYGNRESWVKNNSFDGESYDGTDFEDWTRSANAVATPIGNLVRGETEGVYITPISSGALNYIYQSFGFDALTSPNDLFGISFEYLIYNSTSTNVLSVEILLKIYNNAQTPSYWLVEQDGKECVWMGADDWLNQSAAPEVEVGSSGWQTWERKFTGLPCDGPFIIALYAPNIVISGVYVAFKNVKFFASSTNTILETVLLGYIPDERLPWWQIRQLKPVKKWISVGRMLPVKKIETLISHEYESLNSINGDIVNIPGVLGDVIDSNLDNIPQQFKGSLAFYPIDTRVDTVHLVGESGTANVTVDGLTKLATFNVSTTQTATDFVTAHAAAYDAQEITLTSNGAYLIFTAQVPGVDFTGDTTIENVTGDLTGTVLEDTPARVSELTATSSWSTRAGNESKTLLQMIADEIAQMYERPKQLIQMPIHETIQALNINILGNFQDTINLYNGAVRVFTMNRGEFDVKNRKWDIDLFEIGTGAVIETNTVRTIKYGFLYNWYVVDTGMLAASGWNVSSDSEYTTLCTYLGLYSCGGKLKETGTEYWMSPNTGATNESGFNARGSGQRNGITGVFEYLTTNTRFWTSTAYYNLRLIYNSATDFHDNTTYPTYGWSIRLVRLATEAEQLLADGTACADYTGNDGQTYNTVKIGTQVWTSENLIETKYSDNTDIPLVVGNILWTAATYGAYCYYDNDITNAYEDTEVPITQQATADSTIVTADSTIITADQTV